MAEQQPRLRRQNVLDSLGKASDEACRAVGEALRPLLPDDPTFRIHLIVVVEGRSLRVEAKPDPYRDETFRRSEHMKP